MVLDNTLSFTCAIRNQNAVRGCLGDREGLVLGLSKLEYITLTLQQLHWLPIKYRIYFKIMTIFYKAVQNMALEHICDLVELKR